MKNIKWSQKGLKFQYVALNVACWKQKKSWVEISLEKWNAFETDEFSFETSYERDGPVCTRSASSFCRNPFNFRTHAMRVKWWYHAKFQTFLSSGCSPFQFQGHLAENKSLNVWKIANEVRKGWNFRMWLWMVHIKCKKILSWNKHYWNLLVCRQP